jgi:hypothetical protein
LKQPALKYSLVLLLFAGACNLVSGQSKNGIENYNFMGNTINYTWVPVIHHVSKQGVYSEFRYNYEEAGAASIYVGKTFVTQGIIESSVTPAAGVVFGNYTGGSLALNTSFSYKSYSFCSQSQYTLCGGNRTRNFIYNWSDLYYQNLPWLYSGFTMQQTKNYNEEMKMEAGVLVGFTKNKWTIPVYLFNPLSSKKYFIIGINLEWEELSKKK